MKFEPTKKMRDYLEAYIICPLGSSLQDICDKAKIERTITWHWKKDPDFCEWFNDEINKYMKSYIGDMWRLVMIKARSSFPDRKLFLTRFDPAFTEEQGEGEQVNLKKEFEELDRKFKERREEMTIEDRFNGFKKELEFEGRDKNKIDQFFRKKTNKKHERAETAQFLKKEMSKKRPKEEP